MLNISFGLRIAYFVFMYVRFEKKCEFLSGCEFGYLAFIHNAWFWSAIIFNLFNWAHLISDIKSYYYMRVNSFSLKWLKSTAVIFQIILFAIFISISAISCAYAKDENYLLVDKITRGINVSIFLFLANLFIYVGIVLHKNLTTVQNLSSLGMKRRIILSIVLISLPLIFRSIFNIFYIFIDFRKELFVNSIQERDYRLPAFIILYYGLLELVPMGAQYISVRMVVLYYRSKMDKNLKPKITSITGNGYSSDLTSEYIEYSFLAL